MGRGFLMFFKWIVYQNVDFIGFWQPFISNIGL